MLKGFQERIVRKQTPEIVKSHEPGTFRCDKAVFIKTEAHGFGGRDEEPVDPDQLQVLEGSGTLSLLFVPGLGLGSQLRLLMPGLCVCVHICICVCAL